MGDFGLLFYLYCWLFLFPLREMQTTSRYASRTPASLGEGHSFIALRFGTCTGSFRDIHSFCTANYGTTFPQFAKVNVNGRNESPLYTYLKAQQPFKGFDMNNNIGKFLDEKFRAENPDYAKDPSIKWNFTKFLVDRQGHVIDRFEPTADMKDVEAGIKAALKMK